MSDTEESTNSNYNNEEEIKLNEIYFNRLLEENKNRAINDDSLVHDVNIAFRRLLDLYLYASQYEKIYNLINRIASDNLIRYKDELCRIVGDLFYENEFPINSLMYYRQSIALNPFNLLSIESFENLLNSFIERWHYRMINDQTRNYAYSKAICKKLNSMAINPRILEIGFGCGVLTAHCLQARNSNVYACEKNEIFYQIAEKFLKANQLNSSNPILINKHSYDLSIQNDFNGRQIDVIVAEIFDDGLLGENCLETFYDALYKNKIIKPSSNNQRFNIIPKYACIHICAIESKAIRNMSFFNFKHGNHDIKVLSKADPYTTENINKIQFKLLTEPIEIDKFKIEFDNFELLRNLCEFNTVLKTHSKLKFIQSGFCDAFVVWFDLFLDDDINITNSPFDQSTETRAKCWHQAIYPTHGHAGHIDLNSSLVVEISLKKDCILINKLKCESEDNINNPRVHEIEASAAEVNSLNDSKYEEFYLNCLNEIVNSNKHGLVRIGLYSKSVNIIILEFLVNKYEMNDIELVWFSDCQNDTLDKFMKNQKITKKIKIIEIDSILNNNNNHYKIDYLIYEPLDLNLGVLRKNLFSNVILIRDSLLKNSKLNNFKNV
jgi:predicted RNA methylase